jgi:hypothetical protein
MPKTIIDYSKTIIYRIVCRDLTIKDCYIGHTTNFIKRKQAHKSTCNNDNNKSYNCCVYKFIRDNGNWDNWDMILINTFNCNDKNDACKIEREHIELYNATLNKIIPLRTSKEYREKYKEQNKEQIKEQKKKYYEINKDKQKKYQKEYRESKKIIIE